jgi:hypothetical protein
VGDITGTAPGGGYSAVSASAEVLATPGADAMDGFTATLPAYTSKQVTNGDNHRETRHIASVHV